MADRVKRSYRGETYYAKSKRPGKKTQRVRGYCRRKAKTLAERMKRDRDWPF
jgi:hypothetical protein